MAINKKSKRPKVAVALSGGVDSSVAAALLKKQGYNVFGLHMRLWKVKSPRGTFPPKTHGGMSPVAEHAAEQRAREVARVLDIPFFVVDLQKEFEKKVKEYFLAEYKAGRTPNPCVVCNKEIKFGLLWERAREMGADYFATGHYSRLRRETLNSKLETLNKSKNLVFRMFRAEDKEKDQSYFLWGIKLTKQQWGKILFPIGEIESKEKVRQIAKELGLPTHQTSSSSDVCFLGLLDFTKFLQEQLGNKKGKIIDKQGSVLAEHQGLWFYTIGQRKKIGLSGGPYFVVGKDTKRNVLIVSKNEKDLLKKELVAEKVNWFPGIEPRLRQGYGGQAKLPIKVKAQIRYRHTPALATIYKLPTTGYQLVFVKSQRAITPGQSVVFYSPRRSSSGAKAGEGDELLGGGIIT